MKTKRNILVVAISFIVLMLISMGSVQADTSTDYITSVTISGLDTPVVGNKPSTTITVTTNPENAANVVLKWLKWYNATTSTVMDADSTFEAGHEYYADITLKPTSIYEFSDWHSPSEPNTGFVVYDGTLKIDGWEYNDEKTRCYPASATHMYLNIKTKPLTATDSSNTPTDTSITSVTISDLDTPVVGNKPDSSINVITSPENVTEVINLAWYDATTSTAMEDNSTFETGHEYYAVIILKPTSIYEFCDYHPASDGFQTYNGTLKINGWEYADSHCYSATGKIMNLSIKTKPLTAAESSNTTQTVDTTETVVNTTTSTTTNTTAKKDETPKTGNNTIIYVFAIMVIALGSLVMINRKKEN